MLSVGIRFGRGFDKATLLKLMESTFLEFDHDVLVIGTSPGGVACAREAKKAGKRTAIIKWTILTPAEEEGFDENLEVMAKVLDAPESSSELQVRYSKSFSDRKKGNASSSSFVKSSRKTSKWSRKVRKSRLDMNNELFKRGQQGRKLMHNAATVRELIEGAQSCGWRLVLVTQPVTINWSKMMEHVMDYVMRENWELANELKELNVEVIEAVASFVNPHTLSLKETNAAERDVTADLICIAPSGEYIIPEDVEGATDHGITCDDFIRLDQPPGKTLVVGGRPEGLECAGILADCRFPVTVVSRSKILKGYDKEIVQMIVADMTQRGVRFLENTALTSVAEAEDGQILARFVADNSESLPPKEEKFDTVLFAVGKRTFVTDLNLKLVGVDHDAETQKILVDEREATSVPNIYAVGDVTAHRPEGPEVSEMAGKLLGRRLFHNEESLVDYSMLPSVMFTPTEYAFMGLSENAALYRLGVDCIDVYRGHFKPLEFVLPPRKGLCFAKVVVLKSTDQIIGIHMFGSEAGEVIQGFAAAIKSGMTMSKLRTVIGVPTSRAQSIAKFQEPLNRISEIEF